MSTFIAKVVEDVFRKQNNYKNLIFVLPSQRSCVFLKEEVLKQLQKSSFLPKIISIENYIQEISTFNLINTTQLLFEFYSIYLETVPKETIEAFDAFSQWATIALNDFNELDSYLVNSTHFFENLRDLKRLEEWFQDKKPSKLALNYLQFFEYLHLFYNKLNEKLKYNKVGYQGLIYKESIHNLETYIQNNKSNHVVFVGFNALNKAEETIFQELLNRKLASVYWDVNEQLLNTSNEAGFFLRKYKNEWDYYKKNPFLWVNNKSLTTSNIHIIGTPKNISQLKYAGELLSNQTNYNKTALVLADENLLNLTLNSLPKTVAAINITMGYALKNIPISALFDGIFKLHLNQQKFNKETEQQFYYKDILNVINNPFLNKLFNKTLSVISAKIKRENSIFVSFESLENSILSKEKEQEKALLLIALFKFSKNINAVIKQCIHLIYQLKECTVGIEKEYLFRFYTIFQQLETLNITYKHITNLKILHLFYKQLLFNEKLSFQGEPLQGLQLMGMLETRVLDFDTVIITSVNEGVLPAGKSTHSFIPFDVKKHFKLPTYQEKDAIFSYHFQRLLQRTQNCYLIYNTESDGYGAGEKSRFLTQIQLNNPHATHEIISPKAQIATKTIITIPKTPVISEKLKLLFKKGISPSALVTYIYNPIRFYEQKVLGIREEDEIEETIAVNTMGTVIHDVLEDLYTPYIGKFLSIAYIKEMIKRCETLLTKYFKKHYYKGTITTGKNRLIFEVSKNHIHRFLKQELQLLKHNKQVKILALEKKLVSELVIDGIDFPIKIHGIVDRIDELDGVTRIIDYKTGKVEAKHLKLNDFTVIKGDYDYTKALQVMLYSYLYTSNTTKEIIGLQSGVISFKNLNSGFLKMNFSEKSRGKDFEVSGVRIQEFMNEIKNLIREILDPKTPFTENINVPF
jgi:hypothetical protein